MNTPSAATSPAESDRRDQSVARWIRIALFALVALLVLWAVLSFINDAKRSARAESWDQLEAIRREFQPEQDIFWMDTRGTAGPMRLKYIGALENFLRRKEGEMDHALEGQARWYLASALTNHLLSSSDLRDPAARDATYHRAIAQLEVIRAKLHDHPLNDERWNVDDPSRPTMTRQFIDFLEKNRAWERKHMPASAQPDGDTTIVLRTTRGDLRRKLYASAAPDASKALQDRVVSGALDGTSFFTREGSLLSADLSEAWVRLGNASHRNPKPYDRDGHLAMANDPSRRGRVPEPSRHRILHDRGVVAAWHDPTTEYDDPEDLIFVARRSPDLDYEYTPVARLLDKESEAVLDTIFGSKLWREDGETTGAPGAPYADILDQFQVPVVVVKALAYGPDGALLSPTDGQAHAARAVPTDEEGTLSSLKADAYKVAVPDKPIAPPPSDEPAVDEPKDEAPSDAPADEAPAGDGN